MKYWQHKENGRVGKSEKRPSSHWYEISKEKYEKEKKLADSLKGWGNLI